MQNKFAFFFVHLFIYSFIHSFKYLESTYVSSTMHIRTDKFWTLQKESENKYVSLFSKS